MATRSSRQDEHLFVIRTWTEGNANKDGQWRASVTHVSSGDRRYFTSYEELHQFLDRWKK
jgi:hypothetical protein